MKAGILLVGIAVIVTTLWVSGIFAPPARHLMISDVTANPMGAGAAATMTIANEGAPARLIDVSSTLSEARFHNADRGLPIPAGRSSLAVDAAHIMIAPADAPFENGALLPLTLRFEQAGNVSVKARFMVPEPGSMAAHMAMGHGTMQHEVTDAAPPEVRLTVVEDDRGWIAQIDTRNFTFSEELQVGDHVPGLGHAHVYLGDMKLGRLFSNSYAIGALPPGQHLLRVTLNTNDHRAYAIDGQPIVAETIIEVD